MTKKVNEVILITGSSSGIGRVSAKYLSSMGYKVYGTSRKSIKNTELYEMIQMDVSDDVSVKQGIDYILKREGHIDVVVNNAGIGIAGSIEDTSIEEIKSQFETNLFGVLRVCHEVLPIMRKQRYGYIINIGSIAGSIGVPFQGAYSASKSAIQGLTEVMRMEVKPFGVHAVLVEPGDFNTGFTDSRVSTRRSQINPDYKERFRMAIQTMERDERNGHHPKSIATLVYKIINNPSPQLKYRIGPRKELIAVHLRKFMIPSLFEKMIMKTYRV